MSRKKPAKPASKTAKKRLTGELSSDDLDSVAGGTLWATPAPPPTGDGASNLPMEDVSLSYVKIQLTYKETDPATGKPSGQASGAWPMEKKK